MSEVGRGFERAVGKYVESLGKFVLRNELPAEWFADPDHIAIKCLDAEHYEAVTGEWSSRANWASYTWLNGRRLASIQVEGAIPLGTFGSVRWLEVMEPRPERIGKDPVGIDHAEFVFPDFTVARRVLAQRAVPYEQQANQNHQWLSIAVNERDQEFKLTDQPLACLVVAGIKSSEAQVL